MPSAKPNHPPLTRRQLILLVGSLVLWPPHCVGIATAEQEGHTLPDPPDWPIALAGQVVAIPSGDRIQLDHGPLIRLADIEAPWRPPPDRSDLPWPLAEAAQRTLADGLLGRSIDVLAPSLITDRWGLLAGHVRPTATGAWLNAQRVAEGWARVVPSASSALSAIRALQALEDRARTADLGIWSEPFYRVQSLADLPHGPDGYRLFEGRIVDATQVRDRIYLNFGADYRTDTTLVIDSERVEAFHTAGLPPLQLAGRLVRARGYVRWQDGPRVDLVHPGQIELLDPP